MNQITKPVYSWQNIAVNNKINFVGHACRILSLLAFNIAIARTLNTSEFSAYSWAWTVTSFFQPLLCLGLDQSFSFYFPRYLNSTSEPDIRSLLKFSYVSTWMFSTIVLILGLLVWPLIGSLLKVSHLSNLLLVSFVANFAAALLQVTLGALRALGKLRQSIYLEQYLVPVSPLVIILLMTTFVPTSLSLVIGLLIVFILANFIGIWILWRTDLIKNVKEREPTRVVIIKNYKAWLWFSLPSAAAMTLENLSYSFVLSYSILFLAQNEVSFLAIALRMILFFTTLNMALGPMLMPLFSYQDVTKNVQYLGARISKILYWMTAWTLTISFCLAECPEFIFSIFGREYANLGPLFLWLIPGAFLEGCLGFVKHTKLALGKSLFAAIIFTVGIIVSAVSSFFLMPKMGLAGALASVSCGYIAINVIRFLWLIKESYLKEFRSNDAFRLILLIFGFAAAHFILKGISQQEATLKIILCFLFSGVAIIWLLWSERHELFQKV